MSASARILQLVRYHYQGDEGSFAEAARTIAEAIAIQRIRTDLEREVREGYQRRVRLLENQRRELAAAREAASRPAPRSGTPSTPASSSRGFSPVLPSPAAEDKTKAAGLLQELMPQSFDELLLPVELRKQFDRIILELEYRRELESRGLRARDRILLYGTPGNGKTSSAASIAHALGVPAYGVDLSKIQSSYVGETAARLGTLFRAMEPNSVVVFDEIDAIGGTRTEDSQAASKDMNAVVNTMLTLFDRGGPGIIIATTNRKEILDPALVRRFEETIEVPPPTNAQKATLAARICAKHKVPIIDVSDCENYDAVTKRCKTVAREVVMREILAAEERKIDD